MTYLYSAVPLSWAAVLFIGAVLSATVYSFAYAYHVTNHHLRGIPGPFLARHSNVWLFWAAKNGRVVQTVHVAHKKYGKIVRLQPNHVSINDDAALNDVYGHGSGCTKGKFYDAFTVVRPSIFSTSSRDIHARKRRLLSHAFSAASMAQSEPMIKSHIDLLVRRLDEKTGNSRGRTAEAVFDMLPWLNYLSFDIISDLAFGTPLNMLKNGIDLAEIRLGPDAEPEYIQAIETLNQRMRISTWIGILPSLKRVVRFSSKLQQKAESSRKLGGMSMACVKQRLDHPPAVDRRDMLSRMIEAKDDKGEPSQQLEDLQTNAISLLVGGGDTSALSIGLILYYVNTHPDVLVKLLSEMESAIPKSVEVPTHAMVQGLPYLNACIKESLRLHSLVGIGLQRQVLANPSATAAASSTALKSTVVSEGVTIHGHYFPPGTVLSVPAYSIHHSEEIWGPDAMRYRPERWQRATPRQKAALVPFSMGPRGCIGRNLAEMELRVVVATLVRRYVFTVRQDRVEYTEGFLRRPDYLNVSLERRSS